MHLFPRPAIERSFCLRARLDDDRPQNTPEHAVAQKRNHAATQHNAKRKKRPERPKTAFLSISTARLSSAVVSTSFLLASIRAEGARLLSLHCRQLADTAVSAALVSTRVAPGRGVSAQREGRSPWGMPGGTPRSGGFEPAGAKPPRGGDGVCPVIHSFRAYTIGYISVNLLSVYRGTDFMHFLVPISCSIWDADSPKTRATTGITGDCVSWYRFHADNLAYPQVTNRVIHRRN